MTESKSSSGGIGFFGVLQIVFITLKVTGLVTWSWWLVFLPTCIPLGIAIVAIALYIGIIAYEKRQKNKNSLTERP